MTGKESTDRLRQSFEVTLSDQQRFNYDMVREINRLGDQIELLQNITISSPDYPPEEQSTLEAMVQGLMSKLSKLETDFAADLSHVITEQTKQQALIADVRVDISHMMERIMALEEPKVEPEPEAPEVEAPKKRKRTKPRSSQRTIALDHALSECLNCGKKLHNKRFYPETTKDQRIFCSVRCAASWHGEHRMDIHDAIDVALARQGLVKRKYPKGEEPRNIEGVPPYHRDSKPITIVAGEGVRSPRRGSRSGVGAGSPANS